MIDIIKNKFSKSGAAAVTLYLFKEFKIPPKNADREIRQIYGNITRPKPTERSNRESDEKPLAVPKTNSGIIISAIAVNISSIAIRIDNASDANT